jgi:hypothetical protein
MGRVSLMKCFEFFKILLLVYVPINKLGVLGKRSGGFMSGVGQMD